MSEYKPGKPFKIESQWKIEYVQPTEQQVLDKTIEYLNKYSIYFENWLCGEEKYTKVLVVRCVDEIGPMQRYLSYLLFEHEYVQYERENRMASEFSIAYNIIKDLAQSGTNAPG